MAETKKVSGNTPANQPGQVITPGQSPALSSPVTPPASSAEPPAPPLSNTKSEDDNISWTASEFVAHEKSAGWYGTLLLVTGIIAALIYLITRDIISTAVIIIAAIAFGVLAARKPRQLQYRLDNSGATIGPKHLSYNTLRSFSVVPEGAFSSIVFKPLKRFAPLTTIYYAPEDEDRIINLLSDHLPFEEHKLDAVDNMMRRIRF